MNEVKRLGEYSRKKLMFDLPMWIPEGETPCYNDPAFTETDRYIAALVKRVCITECHEVLACLSSAMEEEGAAGYAARFGVRGGLGPYERYQLYLARRGKKRGLQYE